MSKSRIKRLSSQLQLRLTPLEFERLVEWMLKPDRKPAHIEFTAGAARDCGRVFEEFERQLLEAATIRVTK